MCGALGVLRGVGVGIKQEAKGGESVSEEEGGGVVMAKPPEGSGATGRAFSVDSVHATGMVTCGTISGI